MSSSSIRVDRQAGVARVTLGRPEVRNAFNAEVIAELHAAFEQIGRDEGVYAVVLAGDGKVFCGGADVNWMRASLDLPHDRNVEDARAMSEMFRAIDRCPKPTVARIQGAALGGGAGLAAVCDVVVASDDALFGFTETKLGIIPAVISPFVLAKIGPSHARALFLTGERFDALRAHAIGLVHQVVAADALDSAVDRILGELRTAGPQAVAAAKRLIADVGALSYDETRDHTAHAIAKQRTGAEGQEGLRAFLERRSAGWSK
ncbi:MAG TPA: enoyl-CoA hydratase-related protein [Candidatus Baltobacteraceae bacterium]|jgi:methylglutaconyl-CoA hydratase